MKSGCGNPKRPSIAERDGFAKKVSLPNQCVASRLPQVSCESESSRVFGCLDFGSSAAPQSANFGPLRLPNSTDFEPFLFRLVLAGFGPFWFVLARFGSFWLVLARCSRAFRAKLSQNRAKLEPKSSRNWAKVRLGQQVPTLALENSRVRQAVLSPFRSVGNCIARAGCFLFCKRTVQLHFIQCFVQAKSRRANRATKTPGSCS